MKLGRDHRDAQRRDATLEALRWQNGLEVSYTRGVFHALGRFGVREATLFDDIAPFLSEARPGAAQEEQQGRVLRAARRRGGARAGGRRGSRALRHAAGVGRRRCDGAAGGNARRESGRAGPPMVRVPLAAAATCDRRREGARSQSRGPRLVGEVANG